MVEVYRTNVHDQATAQLLTRELLDRYPDVKINFDLEDCDKVLRVEGKHIAASVIDCLKNNGFMCETLE